MIPTGCFNRDYSGFSQQKKPGQEFQLSDPAFFLKGMIVNPIRVLSSVHVYTPQGGTEESAHFSWVLDGDSVQCSLEGYSVQSSLDGDSFQSPLRGISAFTKLLSYKKQEINF